MSSVLITGSISQRARAYADALDDLEAARSYAKLGWPLEAPKQVTVTWQHGCATPGYREVAHEVSCLISKEMPELIARALAKLEERVKLAHGELEDAAHLGSKGYMRAGEVREP